MTSIILGEMIAKQLQTGPLLFGESTASLGDRRRGGVICFLRD